MTHHLEGRLDDLLDRRLNAAEEADARAHLTGCAQCRRALENLEALREGLRRAAAPAAVPAPLRDAVLARIDDRSAPKAPVTEHLFALAAAVLVAVAAAGLLLWPQRQGTDLPRAIVSDVRALEAGTLPLQVVSTDAEEIERLFSANAIPSRVFDLAMMGFPIRGGSIDEVEGRKSALFVYRSADGRTALCQMFPGRTSELPQTLPRVERGGITFHIAEQNGVTMVFWEEGELVCVLASADLPRQEILELAFGKAMKV